MRVWLGLAGVVVSVLAVSGCAAQELAIPSGTPTGYAECQIGDCGTTSPNMIFSITPDHGPRGTLVTLKVTGCNDPHGDSHSLSYNAVGGLKLKAAQLAQRYPKAVSAIEGTITGETLTGRFRVSYAPRSSGVFSAACSATVAHRTFTVTP